MRMGKRKANSCFCIWTINKLIENVMNEKENNIFNLFKTHSKGGSIIGWKKDKETTETKELTLHNKVPIAPSAIKERA